MKTYLLTEEQLDTLLRIAHSNGMQCGQQDPCAMNEDDTVTMCFDIHRTLYGCKWQSGPIPEPTGPSVLVLETKIYTDHIAIIQRSNSWFYEGEHWEAQALHSYIVMLHEFFTGRWYIQQITLPT